MIKHTANKTIGEYNIMSLPYSFRSINILLLYTFTVCRTWGSVSLNEIVLQMTINKIKAHGGIIIMKIITIVGMLLIIIDNIFLYTFVFKASIIMAMLRNNTPINIDKVIFSSRIYYTTKLYIDLAYNKNVSFDQNPFWDGRS
jgi:hypothetical protein